MNDRRWLMPVLIAVALLVPVAARGMQPPSDGTRLPAAGASAGADSGAANTTPNGADPPAAEAPLPADAAQRAFRSLSNRFPWYDSSRDALRPIRLWVPPDWRFNWRGWKFNFPFVGLVSLQDVFMVAIGLVLGLLLWLVIRYYRRGVPLPRQPLIESDRRGQVRRVEALPEEVRSAEVDLLQAARREYAAGNFRLAVIYLFSHQLVELDRHQFIHLQRGKTNRQYLRELARQPRLRELLDHTTRIFEAVFFGNQPLDRTGFESCWKHLDQFQALLRESSR